jgi:hypothetical protein
MSNIVITSKYVLYTKKEITKVIRDSDGDWQFLSNDVIAESDALVVSLDYMIDYDSTVKVLINMPLNSIAQRDTKNNDWIINNLL